MSNQVKREPIELTINNVKVPATETEQQKGKKAGDARIFVNPGNDMAWLTMMASAFGVGNLNALIYSELVRPACQEASEEALRETTDEVGNKVKAIDPDVYYTELEKALNPDSRNAGGETLPELRRQQLELLQETTALFVKAKKGTITAEESAELDQKMLVVNELAAKIQEREDKKRKAPATKAASPVAA